MMVTEQRMAWACFTFSSTSVFFMCFVGMMLFRGYADEALTQMVILGILFAVSGLGTVIGALRLHMMNMFETEERIKNQVWGDDFRLREMARDSRESGKLMSDKTEEAISKFVDGCKKKAVE